ncbi:hypothetical protein V1525DRAFT_13835 [Lipomyces kononenkoae]|uniref:Uncharacterized protein n=1 Tax=Lipomyces kononenkoae TaxID=34357 RepID=A0ACC3T6V8_LIPKO
MTQTIPKAARPIGRQTHMPKISSFDPPKNPQARSGQRLAKPTNNLTALPASQTTSISSSNIHTSLSSTLLIGMPPKLKDPFLSLAVDNISKLDTSDAENLFSIWTVFSKCAENLENGRRLENLSWRLWNREAFFEPAAASCAPCCPDLSSSVESALSDQAHNTSNNNNTSQPKIQHMRKSNTTDRFQKVIESFNFTQEESLKALRERRQQQQHLQLTDAISNNKTTEVPDSEPVQKTAAVDVPIQDGEQQRPSFDSPEDDYSSETDSDRGRLSYAAPSSTSIVRGFSPSAISVHSVRSELYMAVPRSQPRSVSTKSDAANGFAARIAARNAGAKTKMFFIESSPSESDGFGESVSPTGNGVVAAAAAAAAAANGHPSNLRSSFSGKKPPPPAASSAFNNANGGHKRTSFREEVVTIPSSGEIEDDEDDIEDEDDDDIEDDDDDDDVSESAIDDADSDDWDSVDESGPPSFDERSFFVREDRPVIRSRPSLLSTLLHTEPDRATLATVGSRSTPAIAATYAQRQNSSRSSKVQQQLLQQQQQRRTSVTVHHQNQPSAVPIPEHGVPSAAAEAVVAVESSKLVAVTEPVGVPTVPSTSSSKSQPALSPRSTRRNMLATELSESLRRNLLWERQQKSVTTAAILKRRHTSQDVAKLTHYPELSRGVAGASYGDRHEFDHTEFGYHARGW